MNFILIHWIATAFFLLALLVVCLNPRAVAKKPIISNLVTAVRIVFALTVTFYSRHFFIGYAYFKSGKYEDAGVHLRKYLQGAPKIQWLSLFVYESEIEYAREKLARIENSQP